MRLQKLLPVLPSEPCDLDRVDLLGRSGFGGNRIGSHCFIGSPCRRTCRADHFGQSRSRLALCLLAIGMLVWLTTLDHRSRAQLRLDWFLPQFDGAKRDNRCINVGADACFEPSCRSVFCPITKRNNVGCFDGACVDWESVGWRRRPDASCSRSVLLLSCFHFFYVCWPYTAHPESAGHKSTGWTFSQIDQQTGEMQFLKTGIESWVSGEPHGDSPGIPSRAFNNASSKPKRRPSENDFDEPVGGVPRHSESKLSPVATRRRRSPSNGQIAAGCLSMT